MDAVLQSLSFVATDSVVLASSSGDSDGGLVYLLLLGPLAGVAFYSMTFMRYRNTDKRHEYEHETASEMRGVEGFEHKVDELHSTESKRISGDNSKKPTERLGKGTKISHDG